MRRSRAGVRLALAFVFLAGPAFGKGPDREPAVAGQFYPAGPAELRAEVDALLAAAAPRVPDGEPVALLVPHAGYQYSGAIAAAGFRSLKGKWPTVVLLGPAHRAPVEGAAVWARGAFVTPLGRVAVDEEFAARLLKASPLFRDVPSAHGGEHSLEVELPFLQRTLGEFRIVPVVLNTGDGEVLRRLGEALAGELKRRPALILISSDLSHYPSRDDARAADAASLAAVRRLSPDLVARAMDGLLRRGVPDLLTCACGEAALIMGLHAALALGATRADVVAYANSGELPGGDPARAVGYAAAVFTRGRPAYPAEAATDPQKKALLEAARQAIRDGLDGKPFRGAALSPEPELNLPAAAFVTLRAGGQLRGCIGTTEPGFCLLDSVRYYARAAAFENHRFRPLGAAELAGVRVSVAILDEPKPARVADIAPGDGVVVTKGARRGLFLPSVWEQLPAKSDFLSVLCSEKAGLPADCAADPACRWETFHVVEFSE